MLSADHDFFSVLLAERRWLISLEVKARLIRAEAAGTPLTADVYHHVLSVLLTAHHSLVSLDVKARSLCTALL